MRRCSREAREEERGEEPAALGVKGEMRKKRGGEKVCLFFLLGAEGAGGEWRGLADREKWEVRVAGGVRDPVIQKVKGFSFGSFGEHKEERAHCLPLSRRKKRSLASARTRRGRKKRGGGRPPSPEGEPWLPSAEPEGEERGGEYTGKNWLWRNGVQKRGSLRKEGQNGLESGPPVKGKPRCSGQDVERTSGEGWKSFESFRLFNKTKKGRGGQFREGPIKGKEFL